MVSAKEIAQQLNISPATVSLVLNNKSGVGAETRQRVLDTAKEMGYSKKHAAAPVNAGTIDLVTFRKHGNEVVNSFFEYVTEGIGTRARQLGFTVQISYLWREDLLSNQTKTLFTESQGVILISTEATRSDLKLLEGVKVPLVLVDNTYETLRFNSIMVGNHQGAFCATKYLIDNGHTNLGFVGSPPGLSSIDERKNGFLTAVSLDPRTQKSKDNVILVPLDTLDLYEPIKRQMLALPKMPTAFVLRHDLIANICYQVLIDLGYSIPEDISIIGFDNNPISELITPKLTTMDFSKQRVGLLAVNRLYEMINTKPSEIVRIDIIPKLLIRDSVKSIL